MSDYLHLNVQPDDLRAMSSLALAHMGGRSIRDFGAGLAVYPGACHLRQPAQGDGSVGAGGSPGGGSGEALPCLTEAERAVYRRGRNAHVHAIPKNASRGQYTRATGLEALFGWLYLQGQLERINQLFGIIMEEKEG